MEALHTEIIKTTNERNLQLITIIVYLGIIHSPNMKNKSVCILNIGWYLDKEWFPLDYTHHDPTEPSAIKLAVTYQELNPYHQKEF